MIMLGSATTVSCYVMTKNMDHEGNSDFQCGDADYPGQRLYSDSLTVYFQNLGPYLRGSSLVLGGNYQDAKNRELFLDRRLPESYTKKVKNRGACTQAERKL